MVIIIILIIAAIALGIFWFLKNNKKVPEQKTIPTVETPVKEKTYTEFPGVLPIEKIQNKKAIVQLVTKGFFEIELYPDVPKATSNFISLADDKFYEKKVFYKVTPGIRTDGGSKFVDGKEMVSYQFEDEANTRKPEKGSVFMVGNGALNTNGSRFSIMLGNSTENISQTIFGRVISGQDIVDKIQEGDMIESIIIKNL